uniref:Uncharacterized protein n=1 Tax=Ciona savignyi TaxID=51511 RepID=H2ZCT5_CIOSA
MNLAYVAEHFESLQLYALALGCLLASPGNNDRAKKLASTRYDEINSQLEILCKDKSPLIGLVLISSFMKTFKDDTNV